MSTVLPATPPVKKPSRFDYRVRVSCHGLDKCSGERAARNCYGKQANYDARNWEATSHEDILRECY